ncbi:proteinase inhibitor I4, serpin [Chroococcus sp. FPU101]|nr:proteinase inhibitor I4, serpin [Chroococcus sp. FPU101]
MTPSGNVPTFITNQKLTQSNTEFSFKLFSNLVQKSQNENVFISPASMILALSLLYNGASGQTQQDMSQALGFIGLSLDEINQGNQALQNALQKNQEQIQLTIANSLWTRQEVKFNETFLKNSQQYYQAEVSRLNFTDLGSVKTINQWVSDHTQGKITQIIDSIQPEDVLFLINAIYFKGMWQTPFDAKLTTPQTFYLANGKTKQHSMMSREGEYAYLETEQFQAVKLPYGEGQLNFYLFLPKENSHVNRLLEPLNAEQWKQFTGQFRRRNGLLAMPRFKLEYETNLNETLKTLGMNRIFQKADFSKMTNASVEVSEVKHKTFVEVNEKGTEAAAVTSIGIRATSALPSQAPFTMIVNRPFLCVIQDRQTETILFMGTIVNPQE